MAKHRKPVTILSGQTESDALDTQDKQIIAIELPAAFTGATITFKAVNDSNGTYKDVYNLYEEEAYSFTVPADPGDKICPLTVTDFLQVDQVKVVSASAEAADREIWFSLKDIAVK